VNSSTVRTISAVILARNEERNIGNCLETVRWCDEIVVVDMQSTDRTVAIAREYTDRIFSHEIVTAFDIAKKYAVEQAKGDWVLLIDADEMIPPSLAVKMRSLLCTDSCDVVEIPFRHYLLGDWVRHSGWGDTPLPRLFRQGAILFEKTIHGYMHIAAGARVQRLQAEEGSCIIHFNYTDSRHFMEKLNRYTSVEAEHLHERGEQFSYFIMLRAAVRDFHGRYVKGKGYRDGVRGFALSAMMTFYRILTYIKLWELYEYHDDSVENRYARIRSKVLDEWQNLKP
jgi:glycosyltransferase involved in cell wall biosynthesis